MKRIAPENRQVIMWERVYLVKKVNDYATFLPVDRITIHAILNYESRS